MIVRELAQFINQATFNDLSEEAVNQLKVHLPDSLGTAIGALEGGKTVARIWGTKEPLRCPPKPRRAQKAGIRE